VISHQGAMRHGYGICGKLLRTFQQIPQPRRRRRDETKNSVIQTAGAGATGLEKLYLLDTGLLMGGSFSDWMGAEACPVSRKRAALFRDALS
jgi:hypothetical protein